MDFSKIFAPMHKLSKKKFLLLCLSSNLVKGDITAFCGSLSVVPFAKTK